MASDAIKGDHISNICMDMLVVEVNDFKSGARFGLRHSFIGPLPSC